MDDFFDIDEPLKNTEEEAKIITPGDRLLIDACLRGESARAVLILQLGANPNVVDELVSPLTIACKQGNLQLIHALVEAGANVNLIADHKKRRTPLHLACKSNSLESVKYLLEKGANARAVTAPPKQQTTAIFAAKVGNVEMLKLLAENKVDLNQASLDEARIAPIHEACKNGHKDAVKYLLDAGTPVDLKSGADWRPLHYAAIHGRVEVVELLAQRGADLNAKTETSEVTPLIFASRNYKAAAVKQLLKMGADVNAVDSDNATALIHACRVGALNIVQILVEEFHADVTVIDKIGSSALDEADKMNMWECALLVWKHGCDAGTLKKGQGMGPVRWVRPRITDAPSARYHPGVAAIGSRIYMFGGTGLMEGLVNHDPDSRIPENEPGREGRSLGDLWMIDLDEIESGFIVPLSEKKASKQILLSEKKKGPNIAVHLDQVTCETLATDFDDEDADPSSILSNVPFTAEDGFGYYEVTWLNEGTRGIITMGLADENFEVTKIPGWIKDSYGYHGDDGQAFHNSGQGKPWGPRYTAGDTIGCGINFQTGEVFFTKNGEFLGVAYQGARGKSYHAILGFRNPKAKARLNFGAQPFKFNFQVPMCKWIRLTPAGRHAPQPAAQPRLVRLDDSTLLLFLDFSFVFNGILFMLHTDTEEWELIKTDGSQPWLPPDASLCVVPHLNQLFMWVSGFNSRSLSPNTISQMRGLPHLYSLDLKTWKWTQYFCGQSIDAKIGASEEELLSNLVGLHITLKDKYANSTMTYIADSQKLCFLENSSFLLVDPVTLAHTEHNVAGARHNTRYFTTASIGSEVEIFGGWDERRQQNEVYVLDTKQSTWYKPHVSGAVPRPRNHHQSVVVRTSRDILANANIEDAAVSPSSSASVSASPSLHQSSPSDSSSSQYSKTYIAHLYGWNGRSFIDDFDLLALAQHSEHDELERFFNADHVFDVEFTWNNDPRRVRASRIILAARASKFKEMFTTSDEASKAIVEVKLDAANAPPALFEALLRFLYTDSLDHVESLTAHRPDSPVHQIVRDFVRVVEIFAPEHIRLVAESLLLTRVDVASSMSQNLKWAFLNPLWHDVKFKLADRLFTAHKSVICARSSYMRALFLGGLKESSQEVVELDPEEINPEAFQVFLQFIYTREVNMDAINQSAETGSASIIDVFQLACKYDEKKLIAELEAIIAYNLSAENVCSLLLLADQFNASKLRAECCKFILSNQKEVETTDEDYDSYKDNVEVLLAQYLAAIEALKASSASKKQKKLTPEEIAQRALERKERHQRLIRELGAALEQDEEEDENGDDEDGEGDHDEDEEEDEDDDAMEGIDDLGDDDDDNAGH